MGHIHDREDDPREYLDGEDGPQDRYTPELIEVERTYYSEQLKHPKTTDRPREALEGFLSRFVGKDTVATIKRVVLDESDSDADSCITRHFEVSLVYPLPLPRSDRLSPDLWPRSRSLLVDSNDPVLQRSGSDSFHSDQDNSSSDDIYSWRGVPLPDDKPLSVLSKDLPSEATAPHSVKSAMECQLDPELAASQGLSNRRNCHLLPSAKGWMITRLRPRPAPQLTLDAFLSRIGINPRVATNNHEESNANTKTLRRHVPAWISPLFEPSVESPLYFIPHRSLTRVVRFEQAPSLVYLETTGESEDSALLAAQISSVPRIFSLASGATIPPVLPYPCPTAVMVNLSTEAEADALEKSCKELVSQDRAMANCPADPTYRSCCSARFEVVGNGAVIYPPDTDAGVLAFDVIDSDLVLTLKAPKRKAFESFLLKGLRCMQAPKWEDVFNIPWGIHPVASFLTSADFASTCSTTGEELSLLQMAINFIQTGTVSGSSPIVDPLDRRKIAASKFVTWNHRWMALRYLAKNPTLSNFIDHVGAAAESDIGVMYPQMRLSERNSAWLELYELDDHEDPAHFAHATFIPRPAGLNDGSLESSSSGFRVKIDPLEGSASEPPISNPARKMSKDSGTGSARQIAICLEWIQEVVPFHIEADTYVTYHGYLRKNLPLCALRVQPKFDLIANGTIDQTGLQEGTFGFLVLLQFPANGLRARFLARFHSLMRDLGRIE